MDIALPALVILIIVLPGIAFIWGFSDKRFKLKLKKKDFIVIIAVALIPSLFVHLIGISIANLCSFTRVKSEIIGYLLTGTIMIKLNNICSILFLKAKAGFSFIFPLHVLQLIYWAS